MSDVYVVLERFEEEASVVLFRNERRALRHIHNQREDYARGLDEAPRYIADSPSHVYDNDVGWETWCEGATLE